MQDTPTVSMREALRVWLKVAFLSFGGPAAQIGVMQRLIVDEKGWLDQTRFNHALNFCMLLPGPEAQQLATYVGWLLNGVRGGLLAGIIFVLPGALIMLALSLMYVTFGQVSLVEGALFGLKCAVLAIVAQALMRMAGKVVHGMAAMSISALALVAMFVFGLPFPLIVLSAAVIGLIAFRHSRPASDLDTHTPSISKRVPISVALAWLLPVVGLMLWAGRESVWTQLAEYFSLVSVLSFGGAYAVLAWVAQYAAETREWIAAGEMLDGLGLAETTPGPLILVTQFVGFLAAWRHDELFHPLLAGSLGAMLTTWVMFAPSFLWIFLLAPRVEKLRGNARIAGALRGITAAVVGIIANLALWFGLRLLFTEQRPLDITGLDLTLPVLNSIDPWALTLTLLAIVLLFGLKTGLITTVAVMAGIGMVLELIFGLQP